MEKIDTDVAKLVSMIEDGELQLPEMQRRYVWPATRVRDLLDSLYRGYPSGAILVWETDREMPSRNLAVDQGHSPFKGHKLLLDGQQRLTSLTAILKGKTVTVRDRKRPIDILFNLSHPDGPPVEVIEVDDDPEDSDMEGAEQDAAEDEQNLQERLNQRTFVVSSSALLADRRWVKVSDVFDPANSDAQFLKPLVSSLDDPAFDRYSKRLQALRKIREYPYVMHVLDKSLSYEEVAEIFVRVNSLGMKLRGSDLALAQIYVTVAELAKDAGGFSGRVRTKLVHAGPWNLGTGSCCFCDRTKSIQDSGNNSDRRSEEGMGRSSGGPALCDKLFANECWNRERETAFLATFCDSGGVFRIAEALQTDIKRGLGLA
jgi:hypothetical protein